MLVRESRAYFIVYPSWAGFSYRWEDLPSLLEDPLSTSYAGSRPSYDWQSLGYPAEIQPFRLIDGPEGGGIVAVQARVQAKWLPAVILSAEADIRLILGELSWPEDTGINVYSLAPRENPLSRIPFLPRSLKKSTRVYDCGCSVEHLEAAGDSVFWVVCSRSRKKKAEEVGQIRQWCHRFGLTAEPIYNLSDPIAVETSDWFADPLYQPSWYQIGGCQEGLGLNFSYVVYIAYHLKWLLGKSMYSMHLAAQIDGKPSSRKNWYRK